MKKGWSGLKVSKPILPNILYLHGAFFMRFLGLISLVISSTMAFSQKLVEDDWKDYPNQKQFIGQIFFQDTVYSRKEFSPKVCKTAFKLGDIIMPRAITETSIGNYYRMAHNDGRYSSADWGVRGSTVPISISKINTAFRVFADGNLIAMIYYSWQYDSNPEPVDKWTSMCLPIIPDKHNAFPFFREYQTGLWCWVAGAEPGEHDIRVEYVLTDNKSTAMICKLAEGEFVWSFTEKEKTEFLASDPHNSFTPYLAKNLDFPNAKEESTAGKETVSCSFYSPSSFLTYYFFGEEMIPFARGYMHTREFPVGMGIYKSMEGKRGQLIAVTKSSMHKKSYVLPGMGVDRHAHIRELELKTSVLENGLFGTSTVSAKKTQNASDSEKPVIKLVQPIADGVYETKEKFLAVEVEVTDNKQVFEVLINGQEVIPEAGGSRYSADIPLGYGSNKIEVMAKDVSNNQEIYVLEVERQSAGTKKVIGRNGRDYALVFATNEYDDWNDLTNPINDGSTVAKDLKDIYGFDTKVVENPTLDDFYTELKNYGKKVYQPGDQLFIFITGHGFYDEVFKEGYLVMKDSDVPDDDPGRRSYIAHSTLKTILDNNSCEHIMLVLDACFSGAFESTAHKGGDGATSMARSEFIRQKLQRKSRKFFTSGGKEYVSDGKAGSHSPFAHRFITALRSEGGADKVLTFDEIKTQIGQAKPMPRSGGFGDDAPGSDFIFIKKN